jgi:hypothetical protein
MPHEINDARPDLRKAIAISVTTSTKQPLTGVLEWQTADGAFACEINEEIAQMLSSDLDHFLSQS